MEQQNVEGSSKVTAHGGVIPKARVELYTQKTEERKKRRDLTPGKGANTGREKNGKF